MTSMRPRQSLVDLLFLVLLLLGVVNFFSPVVGIERDPIITYAFVGLAGVVFGVKHGASRLPERNEPPSAPGRTRPAGDDDLGDSET